MHQTPTLGGSEICWDIHLFPICIDPEGIWYAFHKRFLESVTGHDTPVLRYHCRQCATFIRSNTGVTLRYYWMTMIQKIPSVFASTILKTLIQSGAVLEADALYETPNVGSEWLCPTSVCFGSHLNPSLRYTSAWLTFACSSTHQGSVSAKSKPHILHRYITCA